MTQRRVTTKGAVPPGGLLVAEFDHVDASDCFRTPLLPGDSGEPMAWGRALFSRAPMWVRALMRLRNALVSPIRLKTGTKTKEMRSPDSQQFAPFPVIRESPEELLMGLDDRHLNFRFSVRMLDGGACFSTTVHVNNRLGRVYWSVVRYFHPLVLRALVSRIPVSVASLREQ